MSSGFNKRFAVKITELVGSMPAAWAFVALTLVSLPAAVGSHNVLVLVSWIAQTFLQLVLLPIIMVGQNIAAESTEAVIRETHDIVSGELREIKRIAKDMHTVMAKVEEIDDELDKVLDEE